MSKKIYDTLAKVPRSALKVIRGGRMNGKFDISPQFRIETMTENFGLCGVGWRYEVTKKWTEQGIDGQVFAFVDVNVYIKQEGEWSEPIPGTGGNMLIVNEKNGLYHNDEAFKMATTDALSVALRFIGVAADVYAGKCDDSKYFANAMREEKQKKQPPKQQKDLGKVVKTSFEKIDVKAPDAITKLEKFDKWLRDNKIKETYYTNYKDYVKDLIKSIDPIIAGAGERFNDLHKFLNKVGLMEALKNEYEALKEAIIEHEIKTQKN